LLCFGCPSSYQRASVITLIVTSLLVTFHRKTENIPTSDHLRKYRRGKEEKKKHSKEERDGETMKGKRKGGIQKKQGRKERRQNKERLGVRKEGTRKERKKGTKESKQTK